MATAIKGKNLEKPRSGNPSARKAKKNIGGIPDIENPEKDEVAIKTLVPGSVPGSVISVQDAEDTAKAENIQNTEINSPESQGVGTAKRPPSGKPTKSSDNSNDKNDSEESKQKSRSPSAAQAGGGSLEVVSGSMVRPPSAVSLKSLGKKNAVEPVNIPGSSMGSSVSLQSRASKEAWNDETAHVRPPSKSNSSSTSRPASAATSIISVSEANKRNKIGDEITKEDKITQIIPPDMNEAHAYVPYVYARDCVAKMMEDMKKMKRKHITIINDIEENYQYIEKETQNQFNTFVIGLRQQYGNKVKTFRQVIEVHRTELQNKQQYWDEALTSLSNKNKQLLQDKKALLIQNKIDAENMEKKKEEDEKDLVVRLEERNAAFAAFEKEKEEEFRMKSEGNEKEKADHSAKLDSEKNNFKKEFDEEMEKLRNENKIINDQLENEKGEKLRLQEIIDDLKRRPETSAAVTAAVSFRHRAKTPIEKKEETEQTAVLVTDLSEEERQKMENERKEMEKEREEMKRERNRMDKEREDFVDERKHFQEERVVIQGEINNEKKDKEVWKAKYEGLKDSLKEYDDWKKKYDMLLAQYEAVTSVAQVNTTEEKSKAEEEIVKTDKDKVIMEEEKHKLENDVKQWEKDFKKDNGRPPTEADRNDSASEMYKSLEEANGMVNKLEAQLAALEALKRGEIPEPPKVEKETIVVKETEVKTIEIKVPDPELLAYVEMTQAELEAMRKQLTALRNDKSELKNENSKLKGDISTIEATNKELEVRLRQALEEMEALKKQLQGVGEEPLATFADKEPIPVVEITQEPVVPPPELPKLAVPSPVLTPLPPVETKDGFCQTDEINQPFPPKIEEVKQEESGPVVDNAAIEELEKQLREKEKEIREQELNHKDAVRGLEKDKQSLEKDLKKVLKALDKAMKAGGVPSKDDKRIKDLLEIVVAQVREINSEANKAAAEVDKRLKSSQDKHKKSTAMKDKTTEQYKDWEVGWAEENGKEPLLEDVHADKDGHKLHKTLKAANKKEHEDDLLVEALTLIKTGALPERKQEEEVQKQSPALAAASVSQTAGPCNHEEEIEKLENTIEELEKKIDVLEDKARDLESQRDLLTNENKDLEDQIADLRAEVERLRKQVEFHKQKEQELYHQLEEARLQHEQELREQERKHQKEIEEKDEEYRKEKLEMETDIKKLVKLIDKLKRKLAQKVKEAEAPQTELEQHLKEKDEELDELDERVTDMEDKIHDLEKDKEHLNQANKKLEEKLENLESQLTKTETTVTELGAAASAATTAEADNKQLRDDLEALRKKIRELEQDIRVKSKELRELEHEHEKQMRDKEREVKEMKFDIEKLLRLIVKQKKQIKEDKEVINALEKETRDLLQDCHDKDDEIDELIEKLNEGEKEMTRRETKPKKEKDNDYEEIITELKTKVTYLEDNADKNETKAHDYETDYKMAKESNKELEDQVDELQDELTDAHNIIADLKAHAGSSEMLEKSQEEGSALKKRIRTLENEVREREKDLSEKDIEIKEKKNEFDRQSREREMQEREMKSDIKKLLKEIEKLKKKLKSREDLLMKDDKGPDLAAVNEKDEEMAHMERDMEKMEDKAQELEYKVADLQNDNRHIQQDLNNAENDKKKLEAKVAELRDELEKERNKIHFDMQPLGSGDSPIVPMAASTPTAQNNVDLEDLTQQLELLQKQLDKSESETRDERSAHQLTKDELDALKRQLNDIKVELENQKLEAAAILEGIKEKKETEIDNLKRKLSDARKRIDELEHQQMNALPPDAAKEIKYLKALVVASEKEVDNKEVEKADLSAKVRELIAKIKSLENSSKHQKTHSSDAEIKLKHLRQEKDREIKTVQVKADKRETERALQEKKKVSALEQKIRELESGAPRAIHKEKPTDGKADPKELKNLQDKLREAKRENTDLNTRIKQLEKAAAKPTTGGAESDRLLKKQEKLSQELMKKLEEAQKKNKKNEENLHKQEQDNKYFEKDITTKDKEIDKLKAELSAMGVAAKAGIESEEKRKELEKEVKKLHEENKTLSDNWNQERVLRKKYYNIVEDMKGKIRVYARARPISSSELSRGNKEIIKSPDEYTIQVNTQRGQKEWQFDQIFMPDSSQERVFEDTNNLIQSAVDGYNVCIFAYGQTGSGKTFTIIGDKAQQFPGIAPRAFNKIFDLLNENKAKFKFSVSCYMLELYNDKLLDLLSKPGSGSDDKLEIKKDKKGMVHVQGAEVKAARNAKELFALFEEGSKTRHTASTSMNSESSRSHLIISMIIETTNKATGQVVKGKLSLVDLAGSERAAKTNAGAEQLKEAMSINKSLSALGDVISALSSEQSFIPYRNNKLTMLMQDSLGGNAKTLMFVNVSPVDYNADESAISLTYASRVKLITNDAQKNSENKEIARLKAVINKMKKGETVAADEDDA